MRLKDKKAVITGAGSGFGAEIARRFAAEGAYVACVDLNAEAAAEVADKIGEAAFSVGCDVSDGSSVADMVNSVRKEWGEFDTLVNNAAVTQKPRGMSKTPEEEFDRLFSVNVKSLYHMAVHALPLLRERKSGNVINIASVTAIRPRPGMTWYNATKAAVISVTYSMAAELARDGIRVNAIAPAVSRTPMFNAMFGEAAADAAYDKLVETMPLGRLSKPSDIAAAGVYLASDEAEFVTGVILPVDGGRLVG